MARRGGVAYYELCYIESIVHVQNEWGKSGIYFQLYCFDFRALRAQFDANRILVPRLVMDGLTTMNDPWAPARPLPVGDFAPVRCDIRGLWTWKSMTLEQLANGLKLSTVALLGSNENDQLVYIYRA